ncbi:class I tRNA ligase family protein, partial [Edaphobacter sp.]|uniref:class I tRNA ligase family protein n=1 Tax=Edaphobacter sp. TaxID=1934404 RepID=UPI002DB65260
MSDTANKFYLTTPIYYVNARPHIGHAYTTIAADVIARRHRLLGDDTFFLTGTDEHGQKIQRSAEAAGIAPQQFADEVSASFQNLWKRMGITNDKFIRTTDEAHQKGAQRLFNDLFEQGFIYLDSYTGAYCVSDETFVDVSPGDPCPDCGRITETITEENFFFKLSSFQRPLLDLIESNTLKIENESRRNEVLSFLLGPVGKLKEEGFVCIPAMSATSEDLDKSQVISEFVKVDKLSYTAKGTPYVAGALKNISVSRSSFRWGIPVPESAAKIAHQKHVIYVWLDALANYMTAIGYGSDLLEEKAKFKHYWPADLHLVGKEIIRFHCVYWPAFLLALNPSIKLPDATKKQDKHLFARLSDLTTVPFKTHQTWADECLPKAITAHGWLLFENDKMSKSKGNIVRTETILDVFGNLVYAIPFPNSTHAEQDLFATDVLRYFLLREIPFGQDGSFSFDAVVQRYNSDLANGYGNLVSRTLSMIDKYSDGIVADPKSFPLSRLDLGESLAHAIGLTIPPGEPDGSWTQETLIYQWDNVRKPLPLLEDIEYGLDKHVFSLALDFAWKFIGNVDAFLTRKAPWKLSDTNGRERGSILYTAAESIRIITALLYPVLPFATSEVWAQLGLGDIEEAARKGELKNLQWGGLKPGT